MIMRLPCSVNECFEFGWKAFDVAERLQTPIFVLSDLDLGMNQWMSNPFTYPDQPMDRGKILWEEDLNKLEKRWGRYQDVDGDGIPYRTVPGNKHPLAPYFTRGTGHDENARYSEDSETWRKLLARLPLKFQTARNYVPKPVVEKMEGARVAIIAYGSTEPAIVEARQQLDQQGLKTDFLRLRAVPFTQEVDDFVKDYDRIYVIEMNRDGQMHKLLCMAYPEQTTRLISIAYTDGLPMTARKIGELILAKEEN
jgi:2-oxoglutarate ferredoxin oxidoreductase subunit alpha